jgi:carboxypeptidase Taq
MGLFSFLKKLLSSMLARLCGMRWRLPRGGKKTDTLSDLPLPPQPDMHGEEGLPKQDQQHACPSYTKLKRRFRDIGRENGIIEILGRDFLTAMPSGAYASRLGQITYLFRRMHEDLISADVSQLLGEARTHEFANPGDWDEWDRANLREMERLYRDHCHVDPALMERRAHLSFEGRHRHQQVLQDNDWEAASGFLQEQIDLHRKIAQARCSASGETSLYQALVQEYMPDIKVADIEKWFGKLGGAIGKMMPEIMERQNSRPDPVPLSGAYHAEAQMWLNRSLLTMIGFDFDRGGLYETGHNPVEGGTPDDTRLVIKCVDTANFLDSMKSALHEGGHGLYIQGLPRKEWRYQPVASDLGAAMHEAQALLIDMILGRSPEFFDYLSPRVEGLFHRIGDPALTPENLYALRTQVKSSSSRRLADEVTYFSHIKARFDLERDLIDGNLEVKDLPEAWGDKIHKEVGIKPNSLVDGCLQDVHWFVGKFGYFPSYAVGFMTAAQLYYTMADVVGDIPSLIRRGDFGPIKDWLNENIHQKGRLKKSDDLLEEATGMPLDPTYLVNHLRHRYLGA